MTLFIFIFQVKEFANGYTLLREMGFSSNSVVEALLMYDNDTDKAVAHFLNSSTWGYVSERYFYSVELIIVFSIVFSFLFL